MASGNRKHEMSKVIGAGGSVFGSGVGSVLGVIYAAQRGVPINNGMMVGSALGGAIGGNIGSKIGDEIQYGEPETEEDRKGRARRALYASMFGAGLGGGGAALVDIKYGK